MKKSKTMHVWLPHGRSLCDRRFRDPAPNTDDDLELVPVCGSCLVLANRLRRQAAVLLTTQPSVSPSAPREAWAALRGTRWEQIIELDDGDDAKPASHARFDAVAGALEQCIIRLLEECPEARARYRRGISGIPN
jgi:hypothetical protein